MFINKTRSNVAYLVSFLPNCIYQVKRLDSDKRRTKQMKSYKTQAEIEARMAEIQELDKVATPYNIAKERAREWVALRNQLRELKKAGN